MIYYEEKRKILIIPTGFGILAESGDCKDAIEEAFNSGWTAGYNSGVTQDCGDAIEEAFNSGYTAGQEDCPECSGTSCNLADGELNMGADWSGSEVITPAQGYDGFNSVEVNDTGYGQAKYDEGYEAGLNDCSGGTCNLQSGNMPLGREWDGDDTIYPSQGYDGFDSVRIYDDGYGDLKFDSGYTQGFNDGQGGTVALQDKSVQQNTNLVTYYPDSGYNGIRSIYVDATGVYSNGHSDGQNYARSLMSSSAFTDNGTYTNPNGWSSVTVNVQQQGSCNLQDGQFVLDGQFDGNSGTIYPTAGYDGFDSFVITDGGYGQSKFDEGYNSGFTYGRSSFPYRQGYYKAGEDSVIKSFLTGNDLGVYNDGAYGYYNYGLVVAYYYTPSGQPCVITGYDRGCDERWYDAFSSMSVDGGPWQSPTLYYYLTEGWHQIRFKVKDPYLHYAFNHNFPTSPVEDPLGNMVTPYMDALKAVSIPEPSESQSGVTAITGTFKMNNGIRILSSSLKRFGVYSPTNLNGNALSGATNLNIIISHYQGDENVNITSDVQNGILFYPAGKSSTHSSALSGWTKMELF